MDFRKRLVFGFTGLISPIHLIEHHIVTQKSMYLGFNFHSVSNRRLPHVANISSYLSESDFKSNIENIHRNFALARRGEIAAFLDGKSPFPRGKAFVSFDDGLAEGFDIASPILKDYDLPAIFFLTTNFIDNRNIFYRHAISLAIGAAGKFYSRDKTEFVKRAREFGDRLKIGSLDGFADSLNHLNFDDRDFIFEVCSAFDVDIEKFLAEKKPYLSTDQIERLAGDDFFIGAHSESHPDFARLDPGEIEREIVRSCEIIAGITGAKKVPFAFPHSSRGIDRKLLQKIQKNHDVVGPFFDSVSRINPAPFGIPRFDIDPFAEFGKKRDFLARIILYFTLIKIFGH